MKRALFCCALFLILIQVYAQNYGMSSFEDIQKQTFFKSIISTNNNQYPFVVIGTETPAQAPGGGNMLMIEIFDENLNVIFESSLLDSLGKVFIANDGVYLSSDTEIVIIGTIDTFSQIKDGVDYFTFYLKYNLDTKEIVNYFTYDRGYDDFVYQSTQHSDNHFYLSIRRSDPLEPGYFHWCVAKIDGSGQLIWDKIIERDSPNNFLQNHINDIISYGDHLAGIGAHTLEFIDYEFTSSWEIFKMDTSGAIQDSIVFPQTEYSLANMVYADGKFFLTGDIGSDYSGAPYMMCLDTNLNLIWDTIVTETEQHRARYVDLKVINDELYIIGTFRSYTNSIPGSKYWGYLTSWDFNGYQNWERLYVYDTTYREHHIEDIQVVNEEQLIMAGRVHTDEVNPYQFPVSDFLLIRSDLYGCGIYEHCHSTIEDHFLLTTIEELEENSNAFINAQYFRDTDRLLITKNETEASEYHLQLISLNGQILLSDDYLEQSYELDLSEYVNATYVILVYKDNIPYWSTKIIKQ